MTKAMIQVQLPLGASDPVRFSACPSTGLIPMPAVVVAFLRVISVVVIEGVSAVPTV